MLAYFKRKPLEEDFLGINERNRDFVYHLNPKQHFALADDKVKCKEVLHKQGIACAETYLVVEHIGDIGRAIAHIRQYEKLAIKPANGSGGGGILILRRNESGEWESGGQLISDEKLYHHMAEILMGMYALGSTDRVLIEECILPHPFFQEIYDEGVPDFRVILLHDQPIMSMLRVPTDQSDGKANLHQGGLGIGIDMEVGRLKEAFDGQGYHTCHPDNGRTICGKEIPMWQDLLALAVQTSKAFPLNYLGVDIVIDAELGPLIMEINVRPGLGIQLANKQGLRNFLNL